MSYDYLIEHGPVYNIDSATLSKFRFAARDGLKSIPWEDRQAYAEAVERAVLAKQRSQLKGYAEPNSQPRCASRTWHTTGESIGKAIQAQHTAATQAYPSRQRRARTPKQWQVMYDEAMALKRAAP